MILEALGILFIVAIIAMLWYLKFNVIAIVTMALTGITGFIVEYNNVGANWEYNSSLCFIAGIPIEVVLFYIMAGLGIVTLTKVLVTHGHRCMMVSLTQSVLVVMGILFLFKLGFFYASLPLGLAPYPLK